MLSVPTSQRQADQPEADHFAHDIWSRWFRLRSTTGKGFEITEAPLPERVSAVPERSRRATTVEGLSESRRSPSVVEGLQLFSHIRLYYYVQHNAPLVRISTVI
jgi:hypothetical protein